MTLNSALTCIFLLTAFCGCGTTEVARDAKNGASSPRQIQPSSPFGSKAGEEHAIGGVKFCWCPPSRFLMGSPPNEPDHRPDEAKVEVTFSKGFWTGKYEVTQGEWKRIIGAFPLQQPDGEGDDFPVVWVNFAETEYFCQTLTAHAHASGELPASWEMRLPTEAQWEYACRAGTTTATSFGDTLSST